MHLPFCRPYNNRRRVACSPVADRADASAVRTAMDTANAARNATDSTAAALLGWEACGKSAKQEAKDYFEMIVSARTPGGLCMHMLILGLSVCIGGCGGAGGGVGVGFRAAAKGAIPAPESTAPLPCLGPASVVGHAQCHGCYASSASARPQTRSEARAPIGIFIAQLATTASDGIAVPITHRAYTAMADRAYAARLISQRFRVGRGGARRWWERRE